MTLTQLEIFSTVAARRGFTAAAVQLGISQSGVSHAIEALEQEFGVPLLRRGKNLELTDVGARLLRQAQAMLGLAESMRQEASDARGMKRHFTPADYHALQKKRAKTPKRSTE